MPVNQAPVTSHPGASQPGTSQQSPVDQSPVNQSPVTGQPGTSQLVSSQKFNYFLERLSFWHISPDKIVTYTNFRSLCLIIKNFSPGKVSVIFLILIPGHIIILFLIFHQANFYRKCLVNFCLIINYHREKVSNTCARSVFIYNLPFSSDQSYEYYYPINLSNYL